MSSNAPKPPGPMASGGIPAQPTREEQLRMAALDASIRRYAPFPGHSNEQVIELADHFMTYLTTGRFPQPRR